MRRQNNFSSAPTPVINNDRCLIKLNLSPSDIQRLFFHVMTAIILTDMLFQEVNNLVEHGADNEETYYGTPLHLAAATGSFDRVKYLLEQGADPNYKNDDNITALYYAICSRSLKIVKCLTEHGADVNNEGRLYGTPLYYDVKTGSLEIVKCLIKQCVDVNNGGVYESTPLHKAVAYGTLEIIK